MGIVKRAALTKQMVRTVDLYESVSKQLKIEVGRCLTYKNYISEQTQKGGNQSYLKTLQEDYHNRVAVARALSDQAKVLRNQIDNIVKDLDSERSKEMIANKAHQLDKAQARRDYSDHMLDTQLQY